MIRRKSLAWSIFPSLYKTLLIAGTSSVAGRLTASEAIILKHASVHVANSSLVSRQAYWLYYNIILTKSKLYNMLH